MYRCYLFIILEEVVHVIGNGILGLLYQRRDDNGFE